MYDGIGKTQKGKMCTFEIIAYGMKISISNDKFPDEKIKRFGWKKKYKFLSLNWKRKHN